MTTWVSQFHNLSLGPKCYLINEVLISINICNTLFLMGTQKYHGSNGMASSVEGAAAAAVSSTLEGESI